MNAPDRAEFFRVPEGEPKIQFIKDGKVPNAGTFKIRAEDHTIGNLLRTQLLKNNKVLFAGYRIPHPLEPYVEVRVQTTPDTKPEEVLAKELDNLIRLTQQVKKTFDNSFTQYGINAGDGYGGGARDYDDGY